MSRVPSKAFIAVVALVFLAIGGYFATRRTPACAGDGKFMSTKTECQAWGVAADVCAAAIDKARAVVQHSAPRSETSFACEMAYSDCFEAQGGGFYPRPSFCLRPEKGSEPGEIRYLQYESDRMNRRKAKEVRVN